MLQFSKTKNSLTSLEQTDHMNYILVGYSGNTNVLYAPRSQLCTFLFQVGLTFSKPKPKDLKLFSTRELCTFTSLIVLKPVHSISGTPFWDCTNLLA